MPDDTPASASAACPPPGPQPARPPSHEEICCLSRHARPSVLLKLRSRRLGRPVVPAGDARSPDAAPRGPSDAISLQGAPEAVRTEEHKYELESRQRKSYTCV